MYRLFERNIAKFSSHLSHEELYIALQVFYNVNEWNPTIEPKKIYIKLQKRVLENLKSTDINHNLKIIRLYANLGIITPIIFEELAYELDKNFENLNEQGFVDAFISFKIASNDNTRRIMNQLESLLMANLE
jgi:hypothetical protein